jgi:hypothetical protein
VQALVPEAIPTTGFRKWVTTILSTTQVTQNVIILALLFVYRLKTLNPSVKGKPGSEYRLLTVALMLGNKFLDDNTYTNKTWAEVSGISVAEVHIMEVEFLSNMKYALFTSAEEWSQWQNRLGRFASLFLRRLPPTTPRLHTTVLLILSLNPSLSTLPLLDRFPIWLHISHGREALTPTPNLRPSESLQLILPLPRPSHTTFRESHYQVCLFRSLLSIYHNCPSYLLSTTHSVP